MARLAIWLFEGTGLLDFFTGQRTGKGEAKEYTTAIRTRADRSKARSTVLPHLCFLNLSPFYYPYLSTALFARDSLPSNTSFLLCLKIPQLASAHPADPARGSRHLLFVDLSTRTQAVGRLGRPLGSSTPGGANPQKRRNERIPSIKTHTSPPLPAISPVGLGTRPFLYVITAPNKGIIRISALASIGVGVLSFSLGEGLGSQVRRGVAFERRFERKGRGGGDWGERRKGKEEKREGRREKGDR